MWGRCDCHGMKTKYCPIENKRASGKADWEPKGRGGRGRSTSPTKTKTESPYTCGRECRRGYRCTSTVRGGVCPCPTC